MNERFRQHTKNAPELFQALLDNELTPLRGTRFPKSPAIYVFYYDNVAVHVGRTRNLQQRLRGHVSNSHYSASFAFKRARGETQRVATYKPEGSRTALLKDEVFAAAFAKALSEVRGMSVRYLLVDNPIDQYLLELYAALELETSLSEFDTH